MVVFTTHLLLVVGEKLGVQLGNGSTWSTVHNSARQAQLTGGNNQSEGRRVRNSSSGGREIREKERETKIREGAKKTANCREES